MIYPSRPRIKLIRVAVFLALGILGATCEADTLITNVHVISMASDNVIRDRDVLIRNGQFVEIAPAGTLKCPRRTGKVDGQGGYLIPGLMDMHVHLNGGREAQPDMLYLYVANGVTTIASMGGNPLVLDLRRQVSEGELLGPRIFSSTPILGNYNPTPATREEGRTRVKKLAKYGYDFVKVYNFIPKEGYWGIIDAARELDIPVVGHAVRSVGIQGAIKAGQHIVHMEEFLYSYFRDEDGDAKGFSYAGYDETRIPTLAKQLKEGNITVIATLIVFHNILRQVDGIEAMLQSPGIEYLPARLTRLFPPETNPYIKQFNTDSGRAWLEESMAFLRKITAGLHAEGVPILTGTDAVMEIVIPGFSIHDELMELVDAGLTPYEALRAATILPAEFLKIADEVGTIEAGKTADAVLLRENPLDDISHTRNIAGVMVKGTWIDSKKITRRLSEIEKKADQSKKTQ